MCGQQVLNILIFALCLFCARPIGRANAQDIFSLSFGVCAAHDKITNNSSLAANTLLRCKLRYQHASVASVSHFRCASGIVVFKIDFYCVEFACARARMCWNSETLRNTNDMPKCDVWHKIWETVERSQGAHRACYKGQRHNSSLKQYTGMYNYILTRLNAS